MYTDVLLHFHKMMVQMSFFYKVQYSFFFLNYSLQLFCFVIFHRKFKGTIFAFLELEQKKMFHQTWTKALEKSWPRSGLCRK